MRESRVVAEDCSGCVVVVSSVKKPELTHQSASFLSGLSTLPKGSWALDGAVNALRVRLWHGLWVLCMSIVYCTACMDSCGLCSALCSALLCGEKGMGMGMGTVLLYGENVVALGKAQSPDELVGFFHPLTSRLSSVLLYPCHKSVRQRPATSPHSFLLSTQTP